jgi:hypothetical protein
MRFAPGYYWDDPGVPSLVVKYGWLSDFFYSVTSIIFNNLGALWIPFFMCLRMEKGRKKHLVLSNSIGILLSGFCRNSF